LNYDNNRGNLDFEEEPSDNSAVPLRRYLKKGGKVPTPE